ncbi:hemerythrin domain-containing protein [Actinoplanes sp. NPDC089786]|uniref:hemerythrin domain-containing protein n=1 Tax=Actinoplanes sp. NPDC089786 TaxID=3155185 RepID=UPI003427A799
MTSERIDALGLQLIETHSHLRDALDRLRSGTLPPDELALHCVAFCAAVSAHHGGEDVTVFPALESRHPELREVLAGLRHDHEMVAELLRKAAALAGDLDAPGTLAELDGLAAILSSHFAWEERRLVAALNAIESPEVAAAVALPE